MSSLDNMPGGTLILVDELATAALAGRLAAVAMEGDFLALAGPLGAGKTAFARAFIRTLAGPETEVPSPTFTLVQTYDTDPAQVWHCDLYRLADAQEAIELGLEEAIGRAIVLVEWPDRLGPFLPARRVDLTLSPDGLPERRTVQMTAQGGSDWLDRLDLGAR